MFAELLVNKAIDPAARQLLRVRAKAIDPEFPHNGCASLMSALLQSTLTAPPIFRPEAFVIDLAAELTARGWEQFPPSMARSGDIAITDNDKTTGRPAHTFLIVAVTPTDPDVVMILDNQSTDLHLRRLSGKDGRTPTRYLLRTNA